MLEDTEDEADVSTRLLHTGVKRLLSDSIKYEVGVTSVGEWLASAEAAAAVFEVYIARMVGIAETAWVHDRILERSFLAHSKCASEQRIPSSVLVSCC